MLTNIFLRNECEMVYMNEYIQWSEKMISNPDFVKDLEVVDVTNEDEEAEDEEAVEKAVVPPLVKTVNRPKRRIIDDGKEECPVFDENYMATTTLVRDRSISPWKFVLNVDRNRY